MGEREGDGEGEGERERGRAGERTENNTQTESKIIQTESQTITPLVLANKSEACTARQYLCITALLCLRCEHTRHRHVSLHAAVRVHLLWRGQKRSRVYRTSWSLSNWPAHSNKMWIQDEVCTARTISHERQEKTVERISGRRDVTTVHSRGRLLVHKRCFINFSPMGLHQIQQACKDVFSQRTTELVTELSIQQARQCTKGQSQHTYPSQGK